MIKQSIKLYESTRYVPPVNTLAEITDEDIEKELEKAKNADIIVGKKYKTKYNMIITVESLGRQPHMNKYHYGDKSPMIVRCAAKGAHGIFHSNYAVDEILEMELCCT